MREFANYRINSFEEYHLKYLHEVDQNKQLTLVNEDLRKQLAEMQNKLASNQQYTQDLEKKLQAENEKANEFKQKSIEVERKIMKVNAEYKKQEHQVEKLKKLNTEMFDEFDQASNNQIILEEKIKTLELCVEDKAARIKQKDMVNNKLSREVKHFKEFRQTCNERSAKDMRKIKELRTIVSKQQNTISVYEEFMTRFQDRERKILLKLEDLEMYQLGKSQSRFFSSFRRPSHSEWLVKSISSLFTKNIFSDVETRFAAPESNERLV
ncbi:uncharacterized protein-like [Clytia hemisphaerica]|uniref:uncharacterized protein-like n=1 Tax=Clytia hemisphaerica TaxID=252671 RepID=UPI0034D782CE